MFCVIFVFTVATTYPFLLTPYLHWPKIDALLKKPSKVIKISHYLFARLVVQKLIVCIVLLSTHKHTLYSRNLIQRETLGECLSSLGYTTLKTKQV